MKFDYNSFFSIPACLSIEYSVPVGISLLCIGTIARLRETGCNQIWWLPLLRSKTKPFFFRIPAKSFGVNDGILLILPLQE